PVVLGARATLLVARLGGLGGRPLRRGDVLPVASSAPGGAELGGRPAPPQGVPVRVVPGPHLHRFAPDAFADFVAAPWRVSRLADRVGVRLEGARVARRDDDAGVPTPMIRGAVQVTTDGTPIVLGPDHPTTGGYPVLAVVPEDAWPDVARVPPGGAMRFFSSA
ncbi:MAG TPA: biotin-dependent carboxyltransferase family protein, partial [Minicystis sp.]|nr:biotin-dependent carboxyltransferase family protein [Minicystis sp.]